MPDQSMLLPPMEDPIAEAAGEWGGEAQLFWGCLMPRLHGYLPVDTLVEIGCGTGERATRLLPFAARMVLYDPAAPAVEACRARFEGHPKVNVVQGDGRDLSALADGSVDLALSLELLVRAEDDVLESVLRELSRKLVVGGRAFFHHSNLAAVIELEGERSGPGLLDRAASVSARRVRELLDRLGLVCTCQEVVNWRGSQPTDCLTVARRGGAPPSPFVLRENLGCREEARRQRSLARLHGAAALPPPAAPVEGNGDR